MAMLTKPSETIQLGNRSDVCLLCAKKTGKRFAEAKRDLRGKLEGKKVLRASSEICYCLDCLAELVEEYKDVETLEGVNI